MIPAALASLRASFRQQLARLAARPIERGPHDAVREGVLLAFTAEGCWAVDSATVAALAALPDGCGPECVLATLELCTASEPSAGTQWHESLNVQPRPQAGDAERLRTVCLSEGNTQAPLRANPESCTSFSAAPVSSSDGVSAPSGGGFLL